MLKACSLFSETGNPDTGFHKERFETVRYVRNYEQNP